MPVNSSSANFVTTPKRIAYYGGTFDPVHCGHITVARRLVEIFSLDHLTFLPAYHAPHKPDAKPTSAYHRFAMLTLATRDEPRMNVSTLELEYGVSRYTVQTLPQLIEMHPDADVFFVMGADSWMDITTWRDWEKVLLMSNHIVVTRPGYELSFDHVSDAIRQRIVDVQGRKALDALPKDARIYITDAARVDVSATEIRDDVREDARLDRDDDVPQEVAKYIEKYELYR